MSATAATGVGWQGFDPTAGVPLSGESSMKPTSVVSWHWNVAIGGVTVVVALFLFFFMVVGLRQILERTSATRVQRFQRRFNRCGTKLGYDWAPSVTLADRADDLIAAGLDLSSVTTVLRFLQSAHYSPSEVHRDASEVESKLKALERQCRTTDSDRLRTDKATLRPARGLWQRVGLGL